MENRGRTLSVDFANAVGRTVKAQPLTAIDYGQILEIHGLPLPPAFECHFSKNGQTAYNSIGTTTNGIGTVPFIDEQTASGGIITAYIYLHETADDGETEYRIIIPVESRPGVTPAEPTPVQQDVIAQAISALNNAVQVTGDNVVICETNAQASAEYAEQAEADANRADTAWNGAVIAQNSAQASADVASDKATEASQSASTAHSEAQYAHSYAESAHTDAQSASASATSAQNSATSASNSASLAQQYTNTATAKASEAMQSAQSASQSAQTATQSAQDAQNSATQANTYATSAQASAASATASEESASASATSAQASAESAQASADRAEQEADRWYEFLPVDSASGSIAHFTDGAKDVPVKALSVSLEPIQSGTGDPSPDNVRPITGHTQVVVTRTGKNLMPLGLTPTAASGVSVENVDDGYRLVSRSSTSGYLWARFLVLDAHTFAGQTLTLCGKVTLSNPTDPELSIIYRDESDALIARRGATAVNGVATVSYTVPDDAKGNISIALYLTGSTIPQVGWTATWTELQLELSSTATSYEPYTPQSITIPLGDTVYGGTLDVLNGVLTVDRAIINASRVRQFTSDSGYYWYSTSADMGTSGIKGLNAKLISNRMKAISNITVVSPEGMMTWCENNIVRWKEQGSMALAEYQAYLVNNPLQFCYEIANPITINLTANQMTTLLGINNVWSDGGNVTVDYRADVQLYIQKMIANAL